MNLESIPLSNGVKMPRLGYGVYQVDPHHLRGLRAGGP